MPAAFNHRFHSVKYLRNIYSSAHSMWQGMLHKRWQVGDREEIFRRRADGSTSREKAGAIQDPVEEPIHKLLVQHRPWCQLSAHTLRSFHAVS